MAILVGLLSAALAGCASAPRGFTPHEIPRSAPQAVAQPVSYQSEVASSQEELAPPPVSTDETANALPEKEPVLLPTPASRKADGAMPAMPIDLASALAMTDGQNPQVAFARERIAEAEAQLSRARAMWLPSIRGGVNYNKHEGQIQEVAGRIINTSRNSLYSGLGANAVGAGSPAVPGLLAQFHLTDAIHQPRIAASEVAARTFAAQAQANDSTLQTALAYLDLLRAEQDVAIAREAQENTLKLQKLTAAYAKSGQGQQADDDRALAELALRENELERASEGVQVASARLAQLVQLDPTQPLSPQETAVAPLNLVPEGTLAQDLVAQGLSARPEIAENRFLIDEAVHRLRREQCAPLVPSVLLAASYGGMGGGLGGNFRNYGDRFDGDAVAYWELRNFGYGDAAARREADSRVTQARLKELAALDRVAREIVEAHAQVQARRRQIATAQRGIEAALTSYERNLARIENTQGLPLEALQSIQALTQARRDYLRAVSDFNAAQFQLLHHIGGDGGALLGEHEAGAP
ncbi:MAG: TolC family protein [Planctomycetales bacterium]|nr:TolC family protein [Planctomycetales bacterium]